MLSRERREFEARFWIIGQSPLIVHAWSEKAKREMLEKQIGTTRAAREKRNPEADFVASLYEMGEGKNGVKIYGFPVTGLKKALLSSAHKDKGIPRAAVQASLFLEHEMISVRPALAGAVCDLPLVRIYAGAPEMREDMVRIGVGLNKTASLAYRAQFKYWGIYVVARYNPDIVLPQSLLFLIEEAGRASGLGEWRNEKSGVFGAFRLADGDEERAWEAFAAGKGPLPVPKRANLPLAAE
jgi:hypothetical protein